MHKAMMLGVLLLATIITFVVIKRGASLVSPSMERVLEVVALLVSVGGAAAGFTLFKKRLQAIPPMDTAQSKLAAYRAAAIMRWALVEWPALLSVIGFMMTSNYAFLALVIALMLLFAAIRPSTQVITYQLQLTEAEVRELEGSSE